MLVRQSDEMIDRQCVYVVACDLGKSFSFDKLQATFQVTGVGAISFKTSSHSDRTPICDRQMDRHGARAHTALA